MRHTVLDWLIVGGLLEAEHTLERLIVRATPGNPDQNETSGLLQLSAEARPWELLKAEVIYEYEAESGKHVLDEAFISTEVGKLELECGRLYIPFGEYYSHFSTGPLVEFGETRHLSLVASYGPSEAVDGAIYFYRGRTEHNSDLDWGLSLTSTITEGLSLNAGYLSDLSDSQADLLDEASGGWEERVPAATLGFLVAVDSYEFTAEIVQALGSFRELEADRNHPRAWNIEAATDLTEEIEGALRFEGSEELEEGPRYQTGIALTWRVMSTASVTAEYLFATFRNGFVEDSAGREVDGSHLFAFQLSLEL